MQTTPQQGVPHSEHLSDVRQMPDWEGARVFLEIVRRKSFRQAAESLGRSVNSVRNQFYEFERKLGLKVLTRDALGVKLTPEGEVVLDAATRMEAASLDLLRARNKTERDIVGEVKLAVTEGLGTFWICPRLIEFQRAFPKLLIDVRCAMSPPDILRMEADVAVQLTRPETADLKAVKIGSLHTMPFAARSYIAEFGRPKTLAELRKHRIALQVSDQVDTEENFSALFPGAVQTEIVALRTNVSSAHYWSIAKGAGIGMLPTYANAMGAPVVPVDIDISPPAAGQLRRKYDIWLTYHPDGHKVVRVRHLIDWVREAFSPRRFPWFSDEFIHPNELPLTVDGLPLENMFAGFSQREVA